MTIYFNFYWFYFIKGAIYNENFLRKNNIQSGKLDDHKNPPIVFEMNNINLTYY